MGALDRIAIATAGQVGRTLGPRAGLAALRALADSVQDPQDATRAIFGALDHALTLRDQGATVWLLERWATRPDARGFDRVVATCARLLDEQRRAEAHEVATAECQRTVDDGRAFYLRARCAPDAASAADDLRRAARLAQREPRDTHLLLAATARLARVTLEKPRPAPDASLLTARQRLPVLVARLHAKGRYGRVSALDGLVELASDEDREVAVEAIGLAARHVDAEGRLTEIEMDRVRSALAHWPDEEARQRALHRLAARQALAEGDGVGDPELAASLRRARNVLEHADPGPPPGSPTVEWRALDAIAAMRRQTDDVADRLEALVAAVDAARPPPLAPLLTAAYLGRLSNDAAVRAAAERVAARLPDLSGPRPTQGWIRLAERVDDPSLADRLLAIGAEMHEPGADERVAALQLRRAWSLHEEGRGVEALAALRDAKKRSER